MSAAGLSAATDYHRDKKTQSSPLISSTHTVKLFTGNWVTWELSLCTIYRALDSSCSPLGFTTTTELVAPPGILERTGSERSSRGQAGTSWGLRRVCETSHRLARECRLLPTSLAWLETVRAPLRGSGGGQRASARQQSGLPRRLLAVWKEPLYLSLYPGPGPQSAGFLFGIVDPGFRARLSSVFCLASKLTLNLCS